MREERGGTRFFRWLRKIVGQAKHLFIRPGLIGNKLTKNVWCVVGVNYYISSSICMYWGEREPDMVGGFLLSCYTRIGLEFFFGRDVSECRAMLA